jgi:hypothetical protein
VRHTVLIGERPAQDDEARVHEPVHEGRMGRPVGLLLQRPRRVPLRTGAEEHDEERRHPRVLPHGRARPRKETPLWLPRALVFADALTAPDGELRV